MKPRPTAYQPDLLPVNRVVHLILSKYRFAYTTVLNAVGDDLLWLISKRLPVVDFKITDQGSADNPYINPPLTYNA